jgi:hypothetical protein
VRRLVFLLPGLVLAGCGGCGSGGTETVQVTTTLQVTTTVQAAPTESTSTTGPELPSNDPDDVTGQLDIRNFDATRTDDLIAVSLTTYEQWNSSVLAGPGGAKPGPNRITILYDVTLDGKPDYRGRMIWSGGELSLFISGRGSAFEPVPVERPDNVTAQFVHPVDVFFTSGPTKDIQIKALSVYNGALDKAPDDGKWLLLPKA